METNPEITDEMVASQVQAGDAESFGMLIDRFEKKLKRYGQRFLNTPEDIEDMVQEVFIKAYTNIQSFDTSLRFSPWIYRIAHNTFVNALKKQQRQPLSIFDADTIFPQLQSRETADQESLDDELREQMSVLLNKIPLKYREAMVLYFYEELSYKEIASILQIPVTTVGVRITRGKAKLRVLYDNHTKV